MDEGRSCRHKWGAAILVNPARGWGTRNIYSYQCMKCPKEVKSQVLIPECQHQFESDIGLGVDYKMYKACRKCGKQQSE